MNDRETGLVECTEHGMEGPAFVCRHLNRETPVGFIEGYDPDDPETELYQAWCHACDEVLVREGEWNDRSEAFAQIHLVCRACYRQMRTLNRPSGRSLRAYIEAGDIGRLEERIREITGIEDVEWLEDIPPVARYDDQELHPERAIRVGPRLFTEMREFPGEWWMGELDAEGELFVCGVYGDSLEEAVRSH